MHLATGQKLSARFTKLVVFQRANGAFINIRLAALLNFNEFDAKCPAPQPPIAQDKDGNKRPMYEDKRYQQNAEKHEQLFQAWLVLNSIESISIVTKEGTTDVFWDKINDEPDSWLNWVPEMEEAGISEGERRRLIMDVHKINSLTNNAIEEAMANFLAMVEVANQESTQAVEQPSTSSGEPVSDSELPQKETSTPKVIAGTI